MASRLGLYSNYSLLYGVIPVERWILTCKKCGVDTIAISDMDNIFALHEIMEKAHEEGLSVVVSATLTTAQGRIWLFVSSKKGFSNLCTILSYTSEQDTLSSLCSLHEGLVAAACEYSLLKTLTGHNVKVYGALTPTNFEAVAHAKKLGIELIAVEDALYIEKEDIEIHRVLRAIATGKTVGTLGQDDCAQPTFFHTGDEYEKIFSAWPESLQNSENVARMCADLPLFDSLIFPDYPLKNKESPKTELRKRVYTGAHQRYGELSDGIIERIEYELGIIDTKGFAPYFLVMHDIVLSASRSCGRGSGAASIVAYALRITQVDPIAHNLYFERFLTLAREDMPDIDVDFAWDERDGVLRKVFQSFPEGHCARVANHNFFRYRSALRECAKACGLSDAAVSAFFRGDTQDPLWPSIVQTAQAVTGFPRSLSTHCGGVVITPARCSSYVPLKLSREGYPLTAWEKDGVEKAKLVKIDLLGNRSLAVIRDALASLRKDGIVIDEDLWDPTRDEMTVELLRRGDSMGVFYIESPAMRQLQKKTQRGDFDHIVIHSSMIRPAANTYINEYVRRLHGGTWESIHPLLESMLEETCGIMCYQEDVSKAAILLARFSESEADMLRKIIAKKDRQRRLKVYEKRFFEGCRKNGIKENVIEKVWDMMLSFDGYSFNKPHSASYAMVSFQSAYLRAHHGAYFMAAVLSNRGGFYHTAAYISECRRMGLNLKGVDINESDYQYTASKDTVTVGFMAVSQLHRETVSRIITERERRGPFRSLSNLSRRLSIGSSDLTSLVASGALDSISASLSRSRQLQFLLMNSRAEKEEQPQLFEKPLPSLPVQKKEVMTKREKRDELLGEYQALTFLRDHHILYLYAEKIMSVRRIRAYQIPQFTGCHVTLIGCPITRRTVVTKHELLMDFISFEDETVLFETLIFPDVHKRYQALLYSPHPLILEGIVKREYDAYSVEVRSIRKLIV